VGQENVVRTYHTGMIRKRTIPVQLGSLSSAKYVKQCRLHYLCPTLNAVVIRDLSAPSVKDGNHLDPAPPRLSDISLRLTSVGIAVASGSLPRPSKRATNGATPDFVKAKGKLLSRAGDWALAQIRMEHLEAHERGEMTMFISSAQNGSPAALDHAWSVTPRVPAWWPRMPKSLTKGAPSTEIDSGTRRGV
jgi:hypothetical protein